MRVLAAVRERRMAALGLAMLDPSRAPLYPLILRNSPKRGLLFSRKEQLNVSL